MMEDFKQELTTVEKQIAENLAEIRALKQYKKSIENAMRLKLKVDGKQKSAPAKPASPRAETGA